MYVCVYTHIHTHTQSLLEGAGVGGCLLLLPPRNEQAKPPTDSSKSGSYQNGVSHSCVSEDSLINS